MIRIRKWMVLALALLLFLPALSCCEDTVVTRRYTLVPEADPRMRYDCASFVNAWPEEIRAEMTARFPEDRVISGIYYQWQTVLGNRMPIVFAACESEGREILVGAWHYGEKWNTQVISDRFFRSGQEYSIVMKPDYTMEGLVATYKPAVQYDGEGFAFGAGSLGFEFAYYERETDWAVDCPDGAHMIMEFGSADVGGKIEKCLIISSWTIGQGKTEIWHGKAGPSLDPGRIDAETFPTTLEEGYACCEPNG